MAELQAFPGYVEGGDFDAIDTQGGAQLVLFNGWGLDDVTIADILVEMQSGARVGNRAVRSGGFQDSTVGTGGSQTTTVSADQTEDDTTVSHGGTQDGKIDAGGSTE